MFCGSHLLKLPVEGLFIKHESDVLSSFSSPPGPPTSSSASASGKFVIIQQNVSKMSRFVGSFPLHHSEHKHWQTSEERDSFFLALLFLLNCPSHVDAPKPQLAKCIDFFPLFSLNLTNNFSLCQFYFKKRRPLSVKPLNKMNLHCVKWLNLMSYSFSSINSSGERSKLWRLSVSCSDQAVSDACSVLLHKETAVVIKHVWVQNGK